MLTWEKYLKMGIVRKTTINENLISSLIKISNNNLKTISQLKINEETSQTIFKNYYDSLREICEAVALLKGYKIYQHEPITLFLKNILKEKSIAEKFDKFRKLRNQLIYYGKETNHLEAIKAIADIKEIINMLKNKYLKNYS